MISQEATATLRNSSALERIFFDKGRLRLEVVNDTGSIQHVDLWFGVPWFGNPDKIEFRLKTSPLSRVIHIELDEPTQVWARFSCASPSLWLLASKTA